MDVISRRRVVPDRWRPESAPPAEHATAAIAPGDVIVCLERWLADREALLARSSGIGVRLTPADELAQLVENGLHALQLVELHAESFADGRVYSQARLLRSREGFEGVIRASGDVSRDRLAFMERCGFDEFRLPAGTDLAAALAAFDEITGRYQPDAGGGTVIARRRGFRDPAASVPTA